MTNKFKLCYNCTTTDSTVKTTNKKRRKNMSVISIDLRSRTPIFEQIVASVENLVLLGIMKPDEQMPSVRALSAELGINPNTIQKAYSELESRGIIYSVATRGSFVSSDIAELQKKNKARLLAKLEESIRDAKTKSVTKEEILSLAEKIWRESND